MKEQIDLQTKQDPGFWKKISDYKREINIMENINLDPVIPILNSLYAPWKLNDGKTKDPACLMRSFLLMTLQRCTSITKWVLRSRSETLFAILCGFPPSETPSIGAHYGFLDRIIDGPYQKPCKCGQTRKRSELIKNGHRRNLKGEKEAKKNDFDPNHSQSARLAEQLLKETDSPRLNNFYKNLEDLLFQTGIIPNIQSGLISNLNDMVLAGDGSILKTAASGAGKPTCSCRSEGIYKCDHDRIYSSPTAQWCYDHHHDCFFFGDRYYHLVITQNGHDFPVLTHMQGGNESDYTLSLKAIDRFLKAVQENGLDIHVSAFCGDGHHDSYAHYNYLGEKDILPIIPLSKGSQKVHLHIPGENENNIRLDTDGTPLCPAGKKMRHHCFDQKKEVHVYTCPAKRSTRRNGKVVYVFHEEECPFHKDCRPSSNLGPCVRLKSSSDPRLFPPLPRSSAKFQELMDQRSAAERCNFLVDAYGIERAHRNADYGLIRITFAYIVHHAAIRYAEFKKRQKATDSIESIFKQILEYADTS